MRDGWQGHIAYYVRLKVAIDVPRWMADICVYGANLLLPPSLRAPPRVNFGGAWQVYPASQHSNWYFFPNRN